MKRTSLVAIILCIIMLCNIFLTGCWDRRELNEIGMVSAFGLDKDKNTGKYILSTQVIRPSAIKVEGGGQAKAPVEIITTEGNTVFEAIRNISMKFDRRAFFSHNKVLVISEELAREGLLPIIDFMQRSSEIRLISWIVIAKGTTAREIIGQKHGIESTQGAYLNSVLKSKDLNSEVSTPSMMDFIKAVSGKQTDPIGAAMELVQESSLPAALGDSFKSEETKTPIATGVELGGTAVFKKDKLVGFIGHTETRGLNWIKGRVKSGVLNVPSPSDKTKLLAVEIKKASGGIKAKMKNGEISFEIKVKEVGDLVEEHTLDDLSKLPVIEEIESAQKKVIENEIELAMDKVQKELGADIFGFGKALYDKYPDEWEKVKGNWDDIFSKVKYTVKVDASLRKTGWLQKAVMEKEKKEKEIKSRERAGEMLEK